MSEAFAIEATRCPHCRQVVDQHTSANEPHSTKQPRPGDIAVCFYCGGINRITEELGLRAAKMEEVATLPKQTRQLVERASFLIRERSALEKQRN